MKFLSKTEHSQILNEELTYQKGKSEHNKRIKELLLLEQNNFCAYSEKYIQELDSSEVEHFNSSIKYSDDYYNYYAVIRKANLYKKDEKYKRASFFDNMFFQDMAEFNKRIQYVNGGTYEEVNEEDAEAIDLIDFLGFNHPDLYTQRLRHIKRLKKSFEDASYSQEQRLEYFRNHHEELSYITAIENELELDLSEFYS